MNRKDAEKRQDAASTECEQHEADLAVLLDGALDEQAAARVQAHLAACPTCRDEYAWWETAAAELEAIGRTAEAEAPEVDLVDAVMAVVQGREHVREPLVAPRVRRWTWVSLAAAAGVALVCGLVLYSRFSGQEAPEEESVLQARGEVPPVTAPSGQEIAPVKKSISQFDMARKGLPHPRRVEDVEEPLEATRPPDLAALTVSDVVRVRAAFGDDEQAWATLMQWATLTPEQAAEVAASADAVPDAVVAAASLLSPGQAEQLLLTLVGSCPDRAYIRLELAKAYSAEGRMGDEVLAQLEAMRELDPANALPYYLQARRCLKEGDLEGALAALSEARAMEEATTYSLEAAAAREQALLAAGAEPDTARALAAFTGGMREYDFLCDLGNDLLQYGLRYVELGDLGSAQRILEAVHELGSQVQEGAVFAQEQLAGLDIQRAVADVLSGLYQALESTAGLEELQRLTSDTMRLVTDLEGIRQFFESLNSLFTAQTEEDFWRSFSDAVMQVGDLMAIQEWTMGSPARGAP